MTTKNNMQTYDNVNRGALWRNQNRKHENSPYFTGVANTEGTDYSVAGWIRVNEDTGEKYIRLVFTKPTDRPTEHRNYGVRMSQHHAHKVTESSPTPEQQEAELPEFP